MSDGILRVARGWALMRHRAAEVMCMARRHVSERVIAYVLRILFHVWRALTGAASKRRARIEARRQRQQAVGGVDVPHRQWRAVSYNVAFAALRSAETRVTMILRKAYCFLSK